MDNLMKSGKMFPGGPRRDPPPAMYGGHGMFRRQSLVTTHTNTLLKVLGTMAVVIQ